MRVGPRRGPHPVRTWGTGRSSSARASGPAVLPVDNRLLVNAASPISASVLRGRGVEHNKLRLQADASADGDARSQAAAPRKKPPRYRAAVRGDETCPL